jgi:hypothetical protein
MSRPSPIALTVLLLALFAAGTASATTYYIAASGSDSNNGTAKTTPWQLAPGMPGCTGTCAATTPKAGDRFIFRGGDTWHYGAGTPSVGGTWSWNWSGSSASPIYIGVDDTWFAGSSWKRPIMTGDNPSSTAYVSSCAHATPVMFSATDRSYVTIDNFEWTGKCWTSGDGSDTIWYGRSSSATGSVGMTVSNNYFHGWSTCNGCSDAAYAIHGYANNTGQNPNSTITGNVFDGSDSHCNGANDCVPVAIYGDCTYVTNNVFRRIANIGVCNDTLVFAGNNVQYSYEPADPALHGNVMEWLGYGPSGAGAMYIYNNLIANVTNGETIDINVASTAYVFNNVYFNNGNPANCFMDESANGATVTVYHFNETLDNPCTLRIFNTFVGNWHAANMHFIGYSSSLSSVYNNNAGGAANIIDDGGHVFQSESQANSQGYTASNNYAPNSSGDATIGAGSNLTSRCNSMSYAPAANACKAGFAAVTYDATNHVANASNVVPRPSTGNWDAGAYSFGTAVVVNPPSGLTATVQ